MNRLAASFCLCVFTCLCPLAAQNTTYDFLRTDVGARAAALSGSFVSMTDDPTGLFYNPATLSTLGRTRISAGYFKNLLDVNAGHVVYAQALQEFHVALGVVYVDYGTMSRTDASSNVLGSFGAHELAAVAGGAMDVDEASSVGAAVKFISSTLAEYSSSAIALDAGYLYRIPQQHITIGVSVQNIGRQLKTYAGTQESLPIDLRVGITKQPEHLPVLLNLDFHRLQESVGNFWDRFSAFSLGAEFLMSSSVRLRGGYDSRMRQDTRLGTSAGLGGLSFGGGIVLREYQVDYAFNSLGKIGALHRFTIGVGL
jgi:hypothetical protein